MCAVIAVALTGYLAYARKQRSVWYLFRLVSQEEEPDMFRSAVVYYSIFDAMCVFFLILRLYELLKNPV